VLAPLLEMDTVPLQRQSSSRAWHLLGLGLVAAWLLAMARMAGGFSPSAALETLDPRRLAGHLEEHEQWLTVYLQQRRAGYLHRRLQAWGSGYRLQQRLRLGLRLAGREWHIDGRLEATLDSSGGLRHFTYHLAGGGLEGSLEGHYRKGQLLLSGALAGVKLDRRLALAEPPLLDSLLPLLLARYQLRVGRSYSVRLFDPRRLANRPQRLEVVERQVLDTTNGLQPALHLRSGRGETRTEMWIDEEGHLLRQESPLGLRLVATGEAAARSAVSTPAEIEAVDSGAVLRWLGGQDGE